MKKLLQEYAASNEWANQQMVATLLTLSELKARQEIVSSFSSILLTTVHSWSAEYIWLQRLQGAEKPVWIQAQFNDTLAVACQSWLQTSAAFTQYVNNLTEDEVVHGQCRFSDLAGREYNMPVYQILQHVFNHCTYHRGQLVTMLRQVGVTQVPRTDFIAFARLK